MITVRQPWASLIALGIKRLETRSWRTSYRGTVAIHAGRHPIDFLALRAIRDTMPGDKFLGVPDAWYDEFTAMCSAGHVSTSILKTEDGDRCLACRKRTTMVDPRFRRAGDLPLGAIVATANLIDCVPIVACKSAGGRPAPEELIVYDGMLRVVRRMKPPSAGFASPGYFVEDYTDQLPYGDFTPGRWAWLLDDVQPTTERCPACWGSGYDCGGKVCAGCWRDA